MSDDIDDWIETDCNICDGVGWIEAATDDWAPTEVRCPRCNDTPTT